MIYYEEKGETIPLIHRRGIDMSVCCFTGHRPQNLPFGFNEEEESCKKLKALLFKAIVTLITKYDVDYFISGMALGVDMYAAEIVLEVKKTYPHIKLEAAIPCETQSTKWSESFRNRYYNILSECDKETLLQTQYTSDCMQKRNQYMIDKSDYVIAVWDGKPSGTGSTVNYAKQKNKKILTINPSDL